jgi:predicted DNA-binding antitoxin AbrB/MazE fold protein
MTKMVAAIYEHGVLRLMDTLPLAEGARVEVMIIASTPSAEDSTPAKILATIAALPMEAGQEFSGQDHDRILYGD